MEWVLEKQLQQPLQLFKIIWKADNTYIGLNDVMSQTGWTPYMVNRVLTDVSDIYHSMTALYSGVLLSEGNILNIANLQKVQYTDLMAYLFKRSLAVSILIDIFFERVTSNEGIAQRYASSKNTIRQMKNDLNRKLETIGLSISKDYKIVGNERTIRLFFFNIFYTSYVDDQFPFNSLVRQKAIQVELILRRTANTQLTMKHAIRYAYAVWCVRVSHGHYLTENIQDPLKPEAMLSSMMQKRLRLLDNIIAPMFPDKPAIKTMELRSVLAAIYAFGEIDHSAEDLTPAMTAKFDDIQLAIANAYVKTFHRAIQPSILEKLEKVLFPLHFRLLYFGTSGIGQPINKQQYAKEFPIHYQFVTTVALELQTVFIDCDNLFDKILTEYLTATIMNFEVSETLPVVTVTLDMADLPALQKYIAQILMNLPGLYIHVTNQFVKRTDFYISNVVLRQDVKGVVWRTLPTKDEVSHLKEELTKIERRKIQNMRRCSGSN